MRHLNQFITRLSVMGVATLMALAANAAYAHDTAAAVIGKVN
jgi:hypothetical protein